MAVGVIVVAALLAGATAAGLGWRWREGGLRAGREQHLSPSQLEHPLGSRVTLLQFSSSFCAPCRATRQLLAQVAAADDGVAHIELDVADRLDLVRLLDIRRTPTVFVLGPRGEVVRRASGLPRRHEVMAAVTLATGETADSVLDARVAPHPGAPVTSQAVVTDGEQPDYDQPLA